MTIRVAIRHNTHYRFDRPVRLGPHVLRLRPAPHSRSKILSYSLKVTPEDHFLNWQQDPFGNFLARLVFPEKQTELNVEVEVITDMTVINPFDFFVEEYAEKYPFSYPQGLKKELTPYLELVEDGKLLNKWLKGVNLKKQPIIDFLVAINQRLEQDIEYRLRMEPGVQTCEETLDIASGSCRDSAWLMVQILRHLGLAARFCSGYLVQLTPDVKSLDGPSGPEADFTDLHAWCEVYLPGAGWVGLDPTSGLFAGEGHIPLACTPSPQSAAPISGATDKCEVDFFFENVVERVHEDPRITKPYNDDEWADILALGDMVETELQAGDVRLTMGGEPTFVSVDDMDSAQWNTEALGADKLKLAKDLLIRLRNYFAPGGMLHYGQGKWYPGEPTPRWALGCFWRTDEQPLWQNQKLLARVDKDYGATLEDAETFIHALRKKLGLISEAVHPAYEDSLYYLWAERNLPDAVNSRKAREKDDEERRRLAKLLSRGLDVATGYVMPVQPGYHGGWETLPWKMRSDDIILIPGDSPMGLRLPLNSIELPDKFEFQVERDPFEPYGTLPERTAPGKPGVAVTSQQSPDSPIEDEAVEAFKKVSSLANHVVRTALCVEPRDGKLHIFMPPINRLEDFVALLADIEETAHELEMPLVLEGYTPPRDPRIKSLLVTPDPGVIEVNIQPASNWREMVDITTALYDEAHQSRLGTEKFMLDGRHSGTGGGNHVTLGGKTPGDSPLLRRPDLLRSLVTYWQHHPGLSYLFSGLFIGPTSQAPRVDEGRDEMLYELEIAFSQFPQGEVVEPWLVDRLMRNLLIDITGNTHRSEFCIDKLYSPGSPTGRLGILEFRGFEMPPHPRMSLVQILLLRSLVARFWKKPYEQKLIRWGTTLHDRFMLPHYVWSDIKQVVEELNDAGYPFRLEWLAAFEEFRFPHYGRLNIDDIEVELRWAIEPWHVLGEEISSFGTARYVDSSIERMQVKVTGMTEGRHVLVCNGRRVPLRPTGRKEEYVAGVRYRAWQPPSALHPRIPIQVPLVFDLIDTWNGRSIGGCSYHVSHPGGRSYDKFPVNAFEAESRRVNRFFDFGHTAGILPPLPGQNALREFYPHEHGPRPMAPPREEPTREYPHTLDLRRPIE